MNKLKLYSLVVIAYLNIFNVDKIYAINSNLKIAIGGGVGLAIFTAIAYISKVRYQNKTKTNIKDIIDNFKYDSKNIEKIYNPLYKICANLNSDYNTEYVNGLEEVSNLINSDVDEFLKILKNDIEHIQNKIKTLNMLKEFKKSFTKLEASNGLKIKEQYQIILDHLNIIETTILNHLVFLKESNSPIMISIKTANKKIESFNKDYFKLLQSGNIEQYLINQNENCIRKIIQDFDELRLSYDYAIVQVNKNYYEWHKETKVYAKIEDLKTSYNQINQKINNSVLEQIQSYANYFALKNNLHANQELYNALLIEAENITKYNVLNKNNPIVAQAISLENIKNTSKRVYPHVTLYALISKHLSKLTENNNKITLYSLRAVNEVKAQAQSAISALQTIAGFIIFSKDYQDESTARQKDDDIKQLEETCSKLQRKLTTQETELSNMNSKYLLLDVNVNQKISKLSDKINQIGNKASNHITDYSLSNKIDRLANKVATVEGKVARLENQSFPPAYSAYEAPPAYSK